MKSVPNILHDPSTVIAVMKADYVILVEKQEESMYSQIEQQLEQLSAWKKKVLGFIVVGVDTVVVGKGQVGRKFLEVWWGFIA